MSKLNPHDEYFKSVFQNSEAVKDFINGIFPKGIAQKLKLDTLKLTDQSYVDQKLSQSYADLVYQCNYNQHTVQIALLFEHKSYPEKFVRLQLLRYKLNGWEKQQKNNDAFVPVIPVIVYHGKETWHKVSLSDYFKGVDEHLAAYIPDFEYILADISQWPDEEIKNIFHSYQMRVYMRIIKHIYDEAILKQKFTDILAAFEKLLQIREGEEFFETTLQYIYRSTNLEKDTVIQLSQEISTKGGEVAMTTAEKLEQKGRQEGKQEGRQEGIYKTAANMIKKGADDEFIKDCTGLTKKEIQKLREEDDL